MHRLVIVALVLFIAAGPAAAQELKTDQDKALYALGVSLGSRLGPFALTPPSSSSSRPASATARLANPSSIPSRTGHRSSSSRARGPPRWRRRKRRRARGSWPRRRPSRAPSSTGSGLVIKTLKAGTGPSPKATDKVKVHYHGTLTDGTVFDSSVQRGQPATFPLNGVIKCWTEGVQLMKVGGKSRARLPVGPRLR